MTARSLPSSGVADGHLRCLLVLDVVAGLFKGQVEVQNMLRANLPKRPQLQSTSFQRDCKGSAATVGIQ